MTFKRLTLTLITCVLAIISMVAQITLKLSDVTAAKGQTVDVSVSVSGFTDITSMQFSVNWDSTVLAFQGVENLSEVLPAFTEKEIGVVEATSGAIRVAWFDNTLRGVTAPDDTELFTLKFEVIAEAGTSSSVTITNTPIVIEFTSTDSMLGAPEIEEGMLTVPVLSTSINEQLAPNGMQLYQNEPNPFSTLTNIMAIIPVAETMQFYVTDVTGKVVYQQTFKSIQGENTITISRQQLPSAGTYFYTLQGDEYRLSRKMMLLK
ncbi:MAG: cohesin domain-containing protein [Bacteroidota bacterium]